MDKATIGPWLYFEALVHPDPLTDILAAVASGELDPSLALAQVHAAQRAHLHFATLDTTRAARTGHPEVVFGEGKDPAQIVGILRRFASLGQVGLVTRVSADKAEAVVAALPQTQWLPVPRLLHLPVPHRAVPKIGRICVVCAGTSDLPVAEEAAIVAEIFGNRVDRHWDVGVAGIHRLMDRIEEIRAANAIVVVAGMEGALCSVVAGLADRPVIGVPTSVGYGANFGGISALLGMLTSCAPGVSVVNIDNGFGAAMQASTINRLATAAASA